MDTRFVSEFGSTFFLLLVFAHVFLDAAWPAMRSLKCEHGLVFAGSSEKGLMISVK